jgi:hypothetical protein
VPPDIADGDNDTTYETEIATLSTQLAQLEARTTELERRCGGISVGARWCDDGHGTVYDKSSGLVWLKDANCFGLKNWWEAIDASDGLNSGECGLADCSQEGDWHLPTLDELETLVQGDERILASTPGPFTGVQSYYYWSRTTYAGDTSYAWLVYLYGGHVYGDGKTDARYVWPVRGGPWKLWRFDALMGGCKGGVPPCRAGFFGVFTEEPRFFSNSAETNLRV